MEHNPELTSSEIAALWNAFMQNSMAHCVLQHFAKINEDVELTEILHNAVNNCGFVVNEVKTLFENEKHAVPIGFTSEDVNLNAGRLYSDLFALRYIKYMAAAGTASAAMLLEVLARMDVRSLFSEISTRFMKLYNDSSNLLLKKGAFIRSPVIEPMEKVEYIQSESFLSGLLGKHRPLTAIELAHISKNTETNSIGRTFLLGFSQTAKLPEVRAFMNRGSEIAEKQESVFREILLDDNMPLPSTWDSTISSSTEAPFSDKLMMFQTNVLNIVGISSYGASIGASMRADLGGHYSRMMTEILQFAKDGVKLMIDKRWLEQPPQNIDRDALRNRST